MTMREALYRLLAPAALVLSLLFGPALPVLASDNAAAGQKVAFDRKKGNCLACHMAGQGTLPGNVGPPLIAMKARFPERAKLRAQIWDPTVKNPNSMMPPFGKHGVLSEKEIDLVVDFVLTL
jgi:L-cysteine S-thiosulfotransferase